MTTATKPKAKAKEIGPELVGSVSAVELSELRARSMALADVQRRRQEAATLEAIVSNEKRLYMSGLVRKHVTEPSDDQFSVDEETGAIVRLPKTE